MLHERMNSRQTELVSREHENATRRALRRQATARCAPSSPLLSNKFAHERRTEIKFNAVLSSSLPPFFNSTIGYLSKRDSASESRDLPQSNDPCVIQIFIFRSAICICSSRRSEVGSLMFSLSAFFFVEVLILEP